MIEVLLVDDESYVTESLAMTIPWQELGVMNVYQAASPSEALAVMEEQAIDILVTDIRMPEMSGLQLIEQVREHWPNIRCMLLTGHSDFEYAKKAIQLQAVDYLLKPVNDNAFIQSMTSIIEALKEEWEKADKYHQLVYTMKSDHNVLRQNLLGELLLGKQLSDVSIKEKLVQYEVKVQLEDSAMLMAVQLGRYFTGMDDSSVALMEYAIGNIAEEIFAQPYRVWHGKAPHEGLAIVVTAPSGVDSSVFRKERIRELAQQFQQQVGAYLKGDIALVLSGWFTFPKELASAYRSVLSAAYRTRQGDASLLFLEELQERAQTGVKAIEELYKPPTLIHLLESGQWGATREKLGALFGSLDGTVVSKEQLYEVFLSITNAFLYVAHKQGTDIYKLDPAGMDVLLDRSLISSSEKLQAWSDGILEKLEAELRENDSYNKKHVIKQVQEIVMSDLGAETSVKTIADKVFLHPVYLSKIYKSETGESLGDYIIRMRMERAVYLLKSSNKKIYEITTELGYQNPQYFSKIFRKYYGMTPNEYRDQ
ncbi:response regulator [Paenibacillus sp. LHD-117]|uniref:response regulator transcription factor n=1 Tax=Paenibacillus sp. LHD-117 TaxID=3071412 RepID=UPI0027E1A321|nr:response regulator [Paenibacillus sp. LHD-117]MDQ6419482.1 response regulator [Paenibacillus sp. LHD-117]